MKDQFPHFELSFDSKGRFRGRPLGFNPYANKAVTLSILAKQLAELEQQESIRPQTDEVARGLAKKKKALETLSESFSAGMQERVGGTPKRDKRIAKKLRRKAARFDQERK
jgi:hypothetical protein